MRIQPVDWNLPHELSRNEPAKPASWWRIKRLFEKKSALRICEEPIHPKDRWNEFERSSECYSKMVQNFIDSSEQSGVSRYLCRSLNRDEDSDDDHDGKRMNLPSSAEIREILKTLVSCASSTERDLLADTAKIVDKNKICKRKDHFSRKIITENLINLGYDASICKSRWESTPEYPSGQYEFVVVVVGDERMFIDIDFRSEFNIARSTKNYETVLQTLPPIFVGKSDRLQRIISVVTQAARKSLRKKGMPFPPWRRAGYVRSKWLSPTTAPAISRSRTKLSPPILRRSASPVESLIDETDALDLADSPIFRFSEEEEDSRQPPPLPPELPSPERKMVSGQPL